MHIETLRKHRKSLIKARREIKAKLELLDTLLEEAAVEAEAKAFDAFAPERHAARLRAVDRINADAARQREEEAALQAAMADHAEKVTRRPYDRLRYHENILDRMEACSPTIAPLAPYEAVSS